MNPDKKICKKTSGSEPKSIKILLCSIYCSFTVIDSVQDNTTFIFIEFKEYLLFDLSFNPLGSTKQKQNNMFRVEFLYTFLHLQEKINQIQ